MSHSNSDARTLLSRIAQGEQSAVSLLLEPHRPRLRRMIQARLSNALAGRVDPSDVVQETMAEAARRIAKGVGVDCVPFYPWLRQIAFDRLVDLHRYHVRASRRSVSREVSLLPLSETSQHDLARHFVALDASPSKHLLRRELQHRVHEALARLSETDREVLVQRHLEQLPIQEVAAVLKISESAAQSRYRRALERLHLLLGGDF